MIHTVESIMHLETFAMDMVRYDQVHHLMHDHGAVDTDIDDLDSTEIDIYHENCHAEEQEMLEDELFEFMDRQKSNRITVFSPPPG